MAVPYSTLLFAGILAAGSGHVLYTVPAGFVMVLRDVEAADGGSSSDTLDLIDVAAGIAFIRFNGTVAYTTQSWRGRQVFPAGRVLGCNVSSSSWALRVSGYLLTA